MTASSKCIVLLVALTAAIPLLALPPVPEKRIVFLHAPSDIGTEERLEIAARFYGVELVTIQLQPGVGDLDALHALRDRRTVGAAISSDVLRQLSPAPILTALQHTSESSVPLLVTGITPLTELSRLRAFASQAHVSCVPLPADTPRVSLVGMGLGAITHELAGQQIPSATSPACVFSGEPDKDTLLSIAAGNKPRAYFLRRSSGKQEFFLLADLGAFSPAAPPANFSAAGMFSRLAPIMMFVRYAAGEYGWRAAGHFANLTIDDAWLRDPYGHLDYKSLIGQMDAHNFHTTIAFIPWNFDRSDPAIAALVRQRPDRFSVCIHGNNHDHLEFGDYRDRPLRTQVANIRQALARMDEFERLTAIPYSRVMAFPDEVLPPQPTLFALKNAGFTGAANADILPMGSKPSTDPLFYLRAVNEDFAPIPLIRRYPAENGVSQAFLAINAFLENPLLFYGHQSLFERGIDAFNPVADSVNRLQPDARWSDLATVTQYLYRIRTKSIGNYEVMAETDNLVIDNHDSSQAHYDLYRETDGALPIQSVTIDGHLATYRSSAGSIGLSFSLAPGQTAHLVVTYRSTLPDTSAGIAKSDLRVALLRRISDFRDIALSQSRWGRAITRTYYSHGFYDWELAVERVLPLAVSILILLAIFAHFLRRATLRPRHRATR